jgi:PAS domain-containing protein
MGNHPSNSIQEPLQLLLVGPSEEDYFLIRDLLRSHGELITADLDQVSAFQDAQSRLARKPYDLLLFQHQYSDQEALRILQELRQRHQTVPCLFLTEDADETTIAQIVQAGSCECVSRSELSHSSLLRAIRSAVSLSRTERQCRDQEDTLRKLHSAVEQSADIVVITDGAGVIEYVNPAFERVTGYSRGEVIGQTP